MTYPEMYGPEDPDYRPKAVGRNLFMDGVDEADARTMLDRLGALDAPMKVVQLRPLGGAMARVAPDATAFAHRRRAIMANVAAFYTGPDDLERTTTPGSRSSTRELRDGEGAYVNFVADEGPAGIRAAYPPRDVRTPGRGQAPLRPGQRLPPQPERGAGARLTTVSGRDRARARAG